LFTADAIASRDSPMPALPLDATGLPAIRTAPNSTSLAPASAKFLAESLDNPFPWAIGFLFGNTELSLESWTAISGISRFDD
jgi:hypothetical protein